jgi:putative aldouronate transport system permease protein
MNRIFKTRGEKIFDLINIIFMTMLFVIFIYPFLDVFSLSFADAKGANTLGLRFFPRFPLYFDSYEQVFKNKFFVIAVGNTLFRAIVGTTLTVLVTFCGAVVLAKKTLPLRRTITLLIMFTMFFSGGLIPSYLLMDSLGLLGSRWALILPRLTSAWYLFIARNFIMTIPDSIEEAAVVDGAGIFTIIFKIMFPLSMPIIAVIALWSAIGHWNAWFDAMIYVRDNNKIVLQLLLRRILIDSSRDAMGESLLISSQATTPDTVKAATIVVTVLPIACVYPFLQKYFVKGINVGAVKG